MSVLNSSPSHQHQTSRKTLDISSTFGPPHTQLIAEKANKPPFLSYVQLGDLDQGEQVYASIHEPLETDTCLIIFDKTLVTV